jgi:hypothetical protein
VVAKTARARIASRGKSAQWRDIGRRGRQTIGADIMLGI